MTRPTGEDEMSNETEWVLVKRDDLLRWAEDFARDNDPGDDTDIVTPFDDYLLQPPSAPVGVEGLVVKWKKESESLDIHPAGLAARRVCAIELEQALAQQPAAVDDADAGDAEIEALRAEVRDAYAAADSKAGWEWKKRAESAEARAERLAEALRDIESRPWNGVRPIQIAARAALRDHDQEVGNG